METNQRLNDVLSHGPVAWLCKSGRRGEKAFLSEAEVQAAERFYQDFYHAGMESRVTAAPWESASANRSHSGGVEAFSVKRLDARDRLRKACKALGKDLANFTLDAVGFSTGLSDLEKRYNWPARSGKVALKIALQILDNHYHHVQRPG